MTEYYDTRVSDTIRNNLTQKRHRISVRNQVPYITYKRKTRVLFKAFGGAAYVNVHGEKVFFV